MKNGAPSIWSPATPPRFQSSAAPSAAVYQPTAAAASGTINITEISGPPVSPFVVLTQTTHYRRSCDRPDSSAGALTDGSGRRGLVLPGAFVDPAHQFPSTL